METLGKFGIFPITLKSGKVHVLGDALSRIAQIDSKAEDHSEVNDFEVVQFGPQNIIESYDDDQFFGPIWRALQGFWPYSERKITYIKNSLPFFRRKVMF